MSIWSDRIDEHEFQNVLEKLSTRVDSTDSGEIQDTEELEAIDRVRTVLAYLTRLISSLDPLLTPVQPLKNALTNLTNADSEYSAYINDGDSTHLRNANAHLDTVLVNIAPLRPPASPEDLDGLRESVSSFRRSIGAYHHHVEEDRTELVRTLKELERRIGEMSQEVSVQKSRLDQAIATFQENSNAAEQKRREEFEKSEAARNDEAAQAVEQHRQKLSAQLEEWVGRWKEHHDSLEENVEQILEEVKKEMATLQSDLRQRGRDVIVALESDKERAEELLTVITNTGTVHGYQTIANHHRRAAYLWQAIAVIAMIGLVGFAIAAGLEALGTSVQWSVFGARVFVAVAFGIPAAYAAKVADRHQEEEETNRRLELQLASVDTFLQSLPEEERHAVKKEIADRLFDKVEHRKSPGKTDGNALDLLRLALESLAELSRKT